MAVLRLFRLVPGLLLVSLFLFASSVAAQPTNKLIEHILKSLKELPKIEPKNDDEPLRKLLIQRYNVAWDEVKQRCEDYKKGLSNLGEVIQASRDLLTAELEVLSTTEEKVKALERVIEVLRWYETELETALKNGIGLRAEVLRVRHRRLDLEIQVLQLKPREKAVSR